MLLSFVGATTVFILLPGPNVFFLVARGIANGRRAAVVSTAGIESAGLVFVAATAVGLSAVLASSAIAFSTVRYAGAAYLFYLAYRALRGHGGLEPVQPAPITSRRAFLDAFAVGLTNPKVALFFLAFFPQFVDAGRGSVALQTAVLGTIFVAIGFVSDLGYALASGSIGRLLGRRPRLLRRQRYLSAGAFFGLGALAVAGGHRHR